MIAKINHIESLYAAVAYNRQKVDGGMARVIGGNRMIGGAEETPDRSMRLTLLAFDNHLAANRNTEKPVLHISLNPAPDDKLSEKQFASLAKDYMERMGYGDQPYVVYLHEDTGRQHIHIVSVCIDDDGVKIDGSYEWRRSMKACRELEQIYGLKNIGDKEQNLSGVYLKKADLARGDVKRQISNIVKSAAADYRFQTFGEWSALLSCFNVEAKQVKGEHNGIPYNGVIYCVTDDKGNAIGVPLKSSLIGKKYGHEGLNDLMVKNTDDYKAGKWSPKIDAEISLATRNCAGDRAKFTAALESKGIGVVFRENAEGRIYGATFIDHNTREVYNGSRLGKEYSANVFNDLFADKLITDMNPSAERQRDSLRSEPQPVAVNSQKQDLRDDRRQDGSSGFGDTLENVVGSAMGVFDLEPSPHDPREDAAARAKKKKKKKRYYGRQL